MLQNFTQKFAHSLKIMLKSITFKLFFTTHTCLTQLLINVLCVWFLSRRRVDILVCIALSVQRHIQEMAAMASRPFAMCAVNVDSQMSTDVIPTVLGRTDIRASSRRKVCLTISTDINDISLILMI